MTIHEALDVSNRSVSSREAEIFLQDVLQVERIFLHSHPETILSDRETETYLGFVARREQNEPVAYITGYREFYGRRFKTDKRALIPRPETEGIIDRVIAWAPNAFKENVEKTGKPCPLRILELGTGSGNISVTLNLELTNLKTPSQLIATDISPEALELASENLHILSNDHKAGNNSLLFLEADLFNHPKIKEQSPFDLIVANLPYVPTTWQTDPLAQPDVLFYEPDIALFGGEDGLSLYRQFFAQVAHFLTSTGRILIEYGETETGDITPLARLAFPKARITTYQDYAGLDRILEIII